MSAPFGGPTRRPSLVTPASLGLDPRSHVPVDEEKLAKRSETRLKAFTDKAAREFVYVTGKPQRAGIVHLLTDPMVRTVAERPHRLVYHVHGKRGRVVTKTHIPHFATLRVDGTVLVLDFLKRAHLDTPGWARRKAQLKEAYLEDHGILYNAIDETTLRVEPLFSNLSMLHAWCRQPNDRQATIAVRAAIAELGFPTTVGAVRHLVDLPLSEHDAACHGQYDRVLPTVGEMAMARSHHLAVEFSIEVKNERERVGVDTLMESFMKGQEAKRISSTVTLGTFSPAASAGGIDMMNPPHVPETEARSPNAPPAQRARDPAAAEAVRKLAFDEDGGIAEIDRGASAVEVVPVDQEATDDEIEAEMARIKELKRQRERDR